MSKWKTYKLGEIAEIIPGFAFKAEHFGTNGEYVVKIKDIKPPFIDLENAEKVDLKYYNSGKLSKYVIKRGEYAVAMTGATIGKVGRLKSDKLAYLNQRVAKILPKSDFDLSFVYYKLIVDDFYRFILNNIDSQSAQGNISASSIGRFPIQSPDLPTQRQIAQILSSLDDKIELNLQMNQTLEAIAQAIFKEWFVNFNFPSSELGLEGLDDNWILDEKEKNEILKSSNRKNHNSDNELPKGWRMGKLGEICQIKIGRTPPRMDTKCFSLNENDIKWISIKDMGQSGVYIFNTSEYLTKEAVEKFRIPIIPNNTVVLSFKLTVGRVSITSETMTSNEAIAQLNTDIFRPEYLYCYLKTYNWDTLGSTSSIATAINSKSIKEMEILIPDLFTLKKFEEIVVPLFEKIKYNTLQIQTLTQLRDTLLPKLMSGQIEVAR